MHIRLWTIQHESFLDNLAVNKRLFASSQLSFPEWDWQYRWMAQQLSTKIGKPPIGVTYPIWAWFQYNNAKRMKPDLRRTGHLEKGTKGIRIEFIKPANEVLLSDFDLWHFVLGYWYLGENEADALQFEKILDEKGLSSPNFHTFPKNIREKMEYSWLKIFDLDFCDDYFTCHKNNKMIQANCWEIHESEIVKIDRFIAR